MRGVKAGLIGAIAGCGKSAKLPMYPLKPIDLEPF